MKPNLAILPAVWLLALLMLPGIAWLVGERQPVLENRPKVARPAMTVSALREKSTFDQLDGFVRDRLPFREDALDARGRILVGLFDVSTNPQVALGSNGWLYFKPEIDDCRVASDPSTPDPADAIEVLTRTLVASGRGTTVAVAPAKALIHSADRPALDAEKLRCQSELERKVQARLADTPGGVDLATPLLAMEAAGDPPYLRKDTHWNWRGRELWTKLVLDGVRPGLAAEVGLKTIPLEKRASDLGALLGMKMTERDRVVEAIRVPADPPKLEDYLIVGDSQTGSALKDPSLVGTPIAESALPGAWICSWELLAQGACDVALEKSKRAVFEIVGRHLAVLNNTCWRPIVIAAKELRGEPGGWETADAQSSRASSITVPDTGAVNVRLRPASGDRTAGMRLMRFPIARLGRPAAGGDAVVTVKQLPTNGPAAPCATPAHNAEGGAFFLPIPAGRRASDFTLVLNAPPGTRIGRPEEIDLGVNRAAAER